MRKFFDGDGDEVTPDRLEADHPVAWNRWDVVATGVIFMRDLASVTRDLLAALATGASSKSVDLDRTKRFAKEVALDIERITGERE